MTAWQLFLMTLAVGAGAAISAVVFCAAAWLFDNSFRLLESFAAAAHRYAVRNEVVTEYYDACNMESVRRFEQPKPYRVTDDKKKGTKK